MINDIITYHNRGGMQYPSPNFGYGKENVMVNKEVWKDCINFPKYQMSNLGRLKNKDNKRILKTCKNDNGYLMTLVYHPMGSKWMKIHREIMQTFIGPCPKGMVVDHRNRIKDDNRLENLWYCTNRENIANRSIRSKYGSGVSTNKKRFQAQIWIDKKRIHLGTFDTPQEAREVYQNAIPNNS